jgi:hypothetical protein
MFVPGEIGTTTTADKNGVAVFEAYAEYSFDEIGIRIGRQHYLMTTNVSWGAID